MSYMERFIYFVRARSEQGLIRIGSSDHPRRTLEALQAASPVDLTLLGAVEARDFPMKWWGEMLAPWRVRESWYQASPQVLCLVEDVLAGRIEAPGEAYDVAERVPVECTRQDPVSKWAWPEIEPFPAPEEPPMPSGKARELVRRILAKSQDRHP